MFRVIKTGYPASRTIINGVLQDYYDNYSPESQTRLRRAFTEWREEALANPERKALNAMIAAGNTDTLPEGNTHDTQAGVASEATLRGTDSAGAEHASYDVPEGPEPTQQGTVVPVDDRALYDSPQF